MSANAAVRFTGGAMAANAGAVLQTVAGPATLSAALGGEVGKQAVKMCGGGKTAQKCGEGTGYVGGGAAAGALVAGPVGAAGGAVLGAGAYGVKTAVENPGYVPSAIGNNAPAIHRKGSCQVYPQYHMWCEGKVTTCPDCNYTYCSYHFKKGGTLSRGGHMCSAERQCSVVGPALGNCEGNLEKCPDCEYYYCKYHFAQAGLFSTSGGHCCS